MYKVKSIKDVYSCDVSEFNTLDEALDYAKSLGITVEIDTASHKIVGRFGVDSVENGKTPDGSNYSWTKRRNR